MTIAVESQGQGPPVTTLTGTIDQATPHTRPCPSLRLAGLFERDKRLDDGQPQASSLILLLYLHHHRKQQFRLIVFVLPFTGSS